MSGESYTSICPRCGGRIDCYSDYKPHDIASGICLECGFQYNTVSDLVDLAEVNSLRQDGGIEPINELRKPTQEWLDSGYEPEEKVKA